MNPFTLSPALPEKLMHWYRRCARVLPWREDREPYHVWLSEIMLQQTRVEAVKPYYTRFLATLPNIPALAAAAEQQLLKLWEGLGYYSRARNLQKAAKCIMEHHGGVFPGTHEEIAALPGIGPYTAGAISSICFDLPTPAVDGNVLRVCARLLEIPDSVDSPAVKKQISAALAEIYPKKDPGTFTQSLMELGAMVCVPKAAPKCRECPVSALCMAKKSGTQTLYPLRSEKRKRKLEEKTVLLFYHGKDLAILRRADTGLLAGLWELPNLPGTLTPEQAADYAAKQGLGPIELVRSMERKHIFTHIQWHMTGYVFQCRTAPKGYIWASPRELQGAYTLPTAFRLFLDDESL